MTPLFQDQQKASEGRFARDEHFRFLVMARRDKLIAKWAADELSLSSEEAEALEKEVLAFPGKAGHDQDILKHIGDVFSSHGKQTTQAELTAALDLAFHQAREQLGATLPD